MKKYEQIYKIINYAYKKDRFTLQDLMHDFSISKSTALRYIKALEDVGVPLYSEMGRYGGYKILDTYRIPPVTFTPQETYALFFSIKAMELLGSMPFKAEFGAIQEKFLNYVSPKIKNTLEQLNSRISFGSVKITNECPLLENLVHAIIKPAVLKIVYQAPTGKTERRIQPIGIFAEHGNWYCPAFDLDKQQYRLFRCDRIASILVMEDEPLPQIMELDLYTRSQLVNKSADAIDYSIEISAAGKPIYERYHFPNMSLTEKDGKLTITGWMEQAETAFLLDYLHQFGQHLLDVSPEAIKRQFIEQLESLKSKLL